MTGQVVTVTSGKGGVGKTTTTANLGIALARLGRRTVVVDADIGLRNLDVIMGLENRVVYDLVDVVEGACGLRQALVKDKRVEGLYLLPAAQTRDKTAVNPAQMNALCRQLREAFDFILIDSPAGIEQGFRNAVVPADTVIVVTTPEVAAVRDADRVIGLVEAEGKNDVWLLINRVDLQMVHRGEMLSVEDVLDILALRLIGVIPEDDAILVSSNRGTPVTLDGASRAAKAFQDVARRLLGEEVPITLPDTSSGVWQWFSKLLGRG